MRVKIFDGLLALVIAGGSGAALAQGGSGLMAGKYTLTWSADHGSASEQVCLADMEDFRDPVHVVAAYLNDFNSACSTSALGGGVYDVSCSGTLVEGRSRFSAPDRHRLPCRAALCLTRTDRVAANA